MDEISVHTPYSRDRRLVREPSAGLPSCLSDIPQLVAMAIPGVDAWCDQGARLFVAGARARAFAVGCSASRHPLVG
jgi:hypothetical protein